MGSGAFRFEKEMLRPASFALRRVLGVKPNTVTLVEPSIGSVIPDLLLCQLNEESAEGSSRPITNLEATLLSAIAAAGECTLAELLATVFITEERAVEAFGRLERIGRVEECPSGGYRLPAGTAGESAELTAVEFKLRRWAEALEQAATYLQFADRSYVVVDGTQVPRSARVIEAFESRGVGLLRQFGRQLEVVCDARMNRPRTACRLIAVCKAAQHSVLLNE
jgi:hypothetical protein